MNKETPIMPNDDTVFIVDDDPSARNSMQWFLESAGHRVETYSCGIEFLKCYDPDRAGCIVLDLKMAEIDGIDVQERLNERGSHAPIIFVTGHGEVGHCARAMRNGALDFVEKPIDVKQVLPEIERAIASDRARLKQQESTTTLEARLNQLSSRERQVMDLLVAGKTMKSISNQLGICVQTVAKHRARVLEKLGVSGEVELTRWLLAQAGER
jgi:RNA polymerase sigma factor (sigma-70 family)